MGSLVTVLVILWQFWALQGATGLSVHQEPKLLQVKQDSQVTLTCQVVLSQAFEQLRVEWTKDSVTLCPPHITNGTLSLGVCGPQGRLSWQPPGNLTLQLDHVSLNDSGNYVCWATMEIPELAEAKGNGTQLLVEAGGPPSNRNQILGSPGLFFALLGAGGVAVAAVALGTWLWGRRRCRHKDTDNPIYSNVLYKPRGPPRKTEAWPVEGKALDIPTVNQKHESFYAISFPQPPIPQQRLAPKPCPSPRPGRPVSTLRTSPFPGSSG